LITNSLSFADIAALYREVFEDHGYLLVFISLSNVMPSIALKMIDLEYHRVAVGAW
jgi:hypothetical protein